MQLERLSLAGNQIEAMTWRSYHGLRTLRRLDLQRNKLRDIPDRTFDYELTKVSDFDVNTVNPIYNNFVICKPNFTAQSTGAYIIVGFVFFYIKILNQHYYISVYAIVDNT